MISRRDDPGGEEEETYLSKKTHLQLPLSLITPPRMGPRTELTMITSDVKARILPHFSDGTSSGLITVTMENIPEAPMPCSARKMILRDQSVHRMSDDDPSLLTAVPWTKPHRTRLRI